MLFLNLTRFLNLPHYIDFLNIDYQLFKKVHLVKKDIIKACVDLSKDLRTQEGGVFFGRQVSGSTLQIQFGEACDYFTARHGVDTAFETHLDISEFDKLMSCLVKK